MIKDTFASINRRAVLLRSPLLAIAITAFVGVGLCVTAPPSQAQGLADIKAKGFATAVTEDDFKPFEFMEDGVSKGYDNDLLTEVKKLPLLKTEWVRALAR